MAEAGTVAVILPGAFCTLPETQAPPIDLLRKRGVPMALATVFFVVGAQHGVHAVWDDARRSLARRDPKRRACAWADRCRHPRRRDALRYGRLDIKLPAELAYRVGFYPLHFRIFGGFA